MVTGVKSTEKKSRKPAVRKEKSGDDSRWASCRVCADQMFGGPRCFEHNPTPEMRDANPDAYQRMELAVALRNPYESIRCRACSWFGTADECLITKKSGSQCRVTCPRCKQYIKFVRLA